jgi:GNAT superfamily N-acetyltransferase
MLLPDGYSDVPDGKIAAVVTHLEMTTRPAFAGEAEGPLSLRREPTPNLDWYRSLYHRVGDEWLWLSRPQMSDAALAAIIHSADVQVHALVYEGADEGLLELDFRQPGECEIVYFGVTSKLIGRGAGHWLMRRALQFAWSQPITRLWVHTCTFDHPGALAFYQRAGFRPFRRQIEIADDPRLTGAAPRAAARHVPIIEKPGS